MASIMNKINSLFRGFYKDDSGATAIEYGLFAALIAAAIVGTVSLLGGDLDGTFQDIRTELAGEDAET